jgi:hypothetical protein
MNIQPSNVAVVGPGTTPTLESVTKQRDEAWKEIDELQRVLGEYLKMESADGRPARHILREKLKAMIA